MTLQSYKRTTAPYPADTADRDRWVLDRRSDRRSPDPWRAHGVAVEDERAEDGRPAATATIFLTGRECPWRCVMCDLWQHTIATDTPAGAIPAQVAAARAIVGGHVSRFKLYNAGSFFDPRAVPVADYDAVASALGRIAHIVVESHPALVGPRLDRWIAALSSAAEARGDRPPRLEVAMGLETAHPAALDQLHKRMTVDDFARAADALAARGVALRVFLLIDPPFVHAGEQQDWLLRSIDRALACGASVVSLVPTRTRNGAVEALAADGLFRTPRVDQIESRAEAALAHACGRGRLFVDLWDLDRFADCAACKDARRARLHAMNLEQRILPRVACGECGR